MNHIVVLIRDGVNFRAAHPAPHRTAPHRTAIGLRARERVRTA
jgi:hypothetical protein